MDFVIGEDVRNMYKESFFQLARDIFSLDFSQWDALGYWTPTYKPHCFVQDGHVIANVSVTFATMVIEGTTKKVAQIGTVMTAPKYRGQGLSKKLMDYVLDTYKDIDLFYLFANETVLDFYPRFGFKAVPQFVSEVALKDVPSERTNIKKLDFHDDATRQFIYDMAKQRVPASTTVGVIGNEDIVMFHALLAYSDAIYYLQDFEVIVIGYEEDDVFELVDVIAKKEIVLEPLLNVLPAKVKNIRFGFTPNELSLHIATSELQEDGAFFIKEMNDTNYPTVTRYPLTSIT